MIRLFYGVHPFAFCHALKWIFDWFWNSFFYLFFGLPVCRGVRRFMDDCSCLACLLSRKKIKDNERCVKRISLLHTHTHTFSWLWPSEVTLLCVASSFWGDCGWNTPFGSFIGLETVSVCWRNRSQIQREGGPGVAQSCRWWRYTAFFLTFWWVTFPAHWPATVFFVFCFLFLGPHHLCKPGGNEMSQPCTGGAQPGSFTCSPAPSGASSRRSVLCPHPRPPETRTLQGSRPDVRLKRRARVTGALIGRRRRTQQPSCVTAVLAGALHSCVPDRSA